LFDKSTGLHDAFAYTVSSETLSDIGNSAKKVRNYRSLAFANLINFSGIVVHLLQ